MKNSAAPHPTSTAKKKVSPAARHRPAADAASSLVVRPSSSPSAPAFLPQQLHRRIGARIQAYRKLAEVTTQEQLDTLRKTWRDRFGPLPDARKISS
ncbi:MAG: TRCF domain-containing protein [Chthoniobacter sp.]